MITTADRFEIHELLALHAHVFDANELDRIEELFTPDATYDMRPAGLGLFAGLDQLRTAAGRMFASGHSPRAHHLTNVVVTDGGGDRATVRSKALMIMSDGGVQSVTYDDTVRRLDGRWRVSSRLITPAAVPA